MKKNNGANINDRKMFIALNISSNKRLGLKAENI